MDIGVDQYDTDQLRYVAGAICPRVVRYSRIREWLRRVPFRYRWYLLCCCSLYNFYIQRTGIVLEDLSFFRFLLSPRPVIHPSDTLSEIRRYARPYRCGNKIFLWEFDFDLGRYMDTCYTFYHSGVARKFQTPLPTTEDPRPITERMTIEFPVDDDGYIREYFPGMGLVVFRVSELPPFEFIISSYEPPEYILYLTLPPVLDPCSVIGTIY